MYKNLTPKERQFVDPLDSKKLIYNSQINDSSFNVTTMPGIDTDIWILFTLVDFYGNNVGFPSDQKW